MKSLGLEEIKEILRVEVKKSILHAHHVHLGTNEFNSLEVEKSLDSVSSREQKFKEDIAQDLNGYEKELDQKLEGILKSLEKSNSLLLARDATGEKPLFFNRTEKGLAFV